jgi:hypothetical protein
VSVALLQELRFAIGFKKQSDLTTALVAGDMLSLRQTNRDLMQSVPINESDKDDLGKGVYSTTLFKSNLDGRGPWNGRLTSEAAAILASFGIGANSKAVSGGGFKYTCDAPVFATAGLDLPVTTALVQVRTGGAAISDKALIGMACEDFGFQFSLGPGRDNAQFTSNWIGTGKYAKPSAIVMPDIYDEHSLNAGGITELTLVGFDYLANKRFADVQFSWKNNIRERSAFFPGSGSQNGFQLRGRMRRGSPEIRLSATVECDSGSSEEDALLALTEGTGTITCAGATDNSLKLSFPRLRVKASPIGDSDGIAAYKIDYEILEHPTDGVLSIEATCLQDDILVSA